MEAESIQKEFSALLDRIQALPPCDRENILSHLRCALPQLTEPLASATSEIQPTTLCSDEPHTPLLSTAEACDAILSNETQWATPFILDDSLNLGYFVQTHEKSTNIPECGLPTKPASVPMARSAANPEPTASPTSQSTLVDSAIPTTGSPITSLRCPVCRREFHKWAKMEEHLYTAHSSPSVSPVCWHCQGIFASHALLLAHECFDWGQTNVPCQSIMSGSSTAAELHHQRVETGGMLEFPGDGVFVKRRCGLCPKSQTVFTSYPTFRLHKKTVHSRDGVSYSPGQKRRPRPEPFLKPDDGDEAASNEARRRRSAGNFRSVVRYLFDKLHTSPCPHLPSCPSGRCLPDPAQSPMSPCITMSLLAAQRARLRSVQDPSAVASDHFLAPSVPAISSGTTSHHKTSAVTQSVPQRSYCSLTRWLWRRKRRSRGFGPKQPMLNSARNPYCRQYRSQCGRFLCRRCGAVFRAYAHLKAHYLFKHGHVPENLEESETNKGPFPRLSTTNQPLASQTVSHGTEKQGACETQHENTDSAPDANNTVRATSRTRARRTLQKFALQENAAFTDNRDVSPPASASKPTGPPFYCMYCPQFYSTLFGVRRHERQAHRGHYRFWCGYCEFHTNERCALDEHLARHFQIKHFACQFCDARFIVRRELDDHVAFIHSTARNFKCPVCESTFKTAGTLSRHRKIHESRTLHQCTACQATFTRPSNLNRHMQRFHRTPKSASGTATTPRMRRRCRRSTKPSISNGVPVDVDQVEDKPDQTPNTENLADPEEGNEHVSSGETSSNATPAVTSSATTVARFDTAIHMSCPSSTIPLTTSNLVPVATFFLPFVPPVNPQSPSATCHQSVMCPAAADSTSLSIATSNSSSATVTATFSVQLSDPFMVHTDCWPSATGDPLYLLTGSTVTPDGGGAGVEPTVTVTSDRQSCYDARYDQSGSTELHHSYRSDDPAVSSLGSTVLDSHEHISSTNDQLAQIWRPVECDLQTGPISQNFPSLSLVSPFGSDSEPTQLALPNFQDQSSVTHLNHDLLSSHNSPRFPSPVSCLDSPVSASPPHHPTSAFEEYLPVDLGSSVSLALDSDPLTSGPGDTDPQSTAFQETGFHNPNQRIAYQMVPGMRSQFLSPIWTCSTPLLNTFHVYPSSVVDVAPGPDGTDSCSNFSVGYLIGQRQPQHEHEAYKDPTAQTVTTPSTTMPDQITDHTVPGTSAIQYYKFNQAD